MSYSKDFTIEEMGKGLNGTVEVRVEYDWDAPEPMVRYYPDGSGYPGSPGGCEMTSWTVTEYSNGDVTVRRAERPDWFAWLDGVVERCMLADEDKYNEEICEWHGDDGWEPEPDRYDD